MEVLIIKFSSLKWSDNCYKNESHMVKFVISRTLVNPKSRTRFNLLKKIACYGLFVVFRAR